MEDPGLYRTPTKTANHPPDVAATLQAKKVANSFLAYKSKFDEGYDSDEYDRPCMDAVEEEGDQWKEGDLRLPLETKPTEQNVKKSSNN